MAATIPESIYQSSLDSCIHALDLDYYILYYGWLHPYHIYHVFEISVVLSYPGFPTAIFSVGHVIVKHFTPLSLGPHALGGIYYTIICHRPYNPRPAHWRAHSVTCEQRQVLKILSLHPSEDEL